MADGDDQLELDGDEGDEGTEGTEGSGDGDEGTGGTEGTEGQSKSESKRIADLIAARDKETARANKAEAALKTRSAGDGKDGGSNDPVTAALMTELREASLDAVYGEFPELREFGIDRAIIEGSTRAELRTSAVALVGLIKSVSTKARNKALADAGVKAEPSGAVRKPPQDFGAMSDEDFKRYLDTL